MYKAGYFFIAFLLTGSGAAIGQEIPEKPEGMDPQEWADSLYPSATTCAPCHPRQFEEWSYSSHAYAIVSPMFNKFEQAINDFAQGTINYFCLRCHASVATTLGELRDIPFWERSKASQEGITCVTCHRVGEAYGKVNGERRITPGTIHESVQGPYADGGLEEVANNLRRYQITGPNEPNDKPGWVRMHMESTKSDVLTRSEFCVACHQVQVHPGIKLETVWEEYRASPAWRKASPARTAT